MAKFFVVKNGSREDGGANHTFHVLPYLLFGTQFLIEACEAGRRTRVGTHPSQAMPTGVVKFYLEEKGYGFIVPDDESIDVFVHHSGISQGAKGTLAATSSTTSPP